MTKKTGMDFSVAGATAPATTASSARKSVRRFGRGSAAGTVARTEHRKLNRIPLASALGAGNLLRLIQHNLLKVRLAIFANVFVYGHRSRSRL